MVDFAAIQAVPVGTTNGTPLPNVPPNIKGVVLYLPSAATVTYAVASAQPTSAPVAFVAVGATGPTTMITEPLLPGQNLYITAGGATAFFRWLMGG